MLFIDVFTNTKTSPMLLAKQFLGFPANDQDV